jgi:hypothetical protein
MKLLNPTTGFTRSQGPSRFEAFWVNEISRYLELKRIPEPGEPGRSLLKL